MSSVKRFMAGKKAAAGDDAGGGGEDRSGLCRADGCPQLWSIDAGDGRFCRWHFGVREDAQRWPRISAEQREAATQRAFEREQRAAPAPQDKRVALARLSAASAALGSSRPPDQQAWMARLQARKDAGERLGAAQLHCLSAAKLYGERAQQRDGDMSGDEHARRRDDKRRRDERVAEYAQGLGAPLAGRAAV